MAVSKKPRLPGFHILYPLLLGASFVFLTWPGNHFLTGIDDLWTDSLFRLRGPQKGDKRICIIAIDESSIREIGEFPWPRGIHAQLIDRLFAAGAKVVGMDILFLEPSGNASQDQALIAATKRAGERLVHAIMVDPSITYEHAFVQPFEGLRRASKSLGLVNQIFIDNDGSVRHSPLIVGARPIGQYETYLEDPQSRPSFGVASLALYEGKDPREYARRTGVRLRLNYRGDEELEQRITKGGENRTIFSVRPAFKHISAWRVLKGDYILDEQEALSGAIALVGSTTIGDFDHYPNPFTSSAPGVEIHATAIDNLLNNRWLREASPLLAPVLAVAMVLLGMAVMALGPIRATLAIVVLLASWAGLSYWLFAAKYLVVPFTGPAVALFGTFVGLMIHKTVVEGRRAREIRQMFGQYVSPEVVEVLVRNPGKLSLGGERRDMTMFFLDIAHFTTISEKMPPENLIQFLNHYLTALTDDVLRHKGVVDKYIGDCVMAFWNAPIEEPAHREKGCLAAVDCVRTIERLNREYVDPSMPEKPAVRIGLNSGEVIVGNTGSARKLAYTVLGDEVNLASRLEGANKFFGSTVIASENTFVGANGSVEGRILGRVRVVGKEIPILVYELLARKGDLSDGWAQALPVYHEAVDHYAARRFEAAQKGFARVLELVPGDKPSSLYLSNCENYLVIPPPDTWEAVFNLTAK